MKKGRLELLLLMFTKSVKVNQSHPLRRCPTKPGSSYQTRPIRPSARTGNSVYRSGCYWSEITWELLLGRREPLPLYGESQLSEFFGICRQLEEGADPAANPQGPPGRNTSPEGSPVAPRGGHPSCLSAPSKYDGEMDGRHTLRIQIQDPKSLDYCLHATFCIQ